MAEFGMAIDRGPGRHDIIKTYVMSCVTSDAMLAFARRLLRDARPGDTVTVTLEFARRTDMQGAMDACDATDLLGPHTKECNRLRDCIPVDMDAECPDTE